MITLAPHGLSRWSTYLAERFPPGRHGVVVAAYSSSSVCYSALLRDQAQLPSPGALAVAFASALLFFFQLRVLDEFKDYEDDARWRPYRPVPRGLVTLRELGMLGMGAGLVQLALALAWDAALVAPLAVVWAYSLLMGKEFFVRRWLKARPVLYMGSHAVIVPLITFYLTACDWLRAGHTVPHGLGWFMATSYVASGVIEIGRKIRAPADEEAGVETYSSLWGGRAAIAALLCTMLTTAVLAVGAAHRIGTVMFVVPLAALLLAAGLVAAWRFLANPAPGEGKVFENLSGLWTLTIYLSVGALPLLWRVWGAGSP
jgi:4-hydroxybenzoate polyprenyltransferase